MKVMLTGMNGTVAPEVYKEICNKGWEPVIWDRNRISIDSFDSVFSFLDETRPDMFIHLATGPVTWLEYIAKATRMLGVKLLFTSSVSVFSEKGSGPYDKNSIPDAEEDYGRYKIDCENTLQHHNSQAIILRLGWQIGTEAGSNNMFDYLTKMQQEHGLIDASSKWYPSCSFLEDTAKIIVEATTLEPGTYLINANHQHSFFDIVNYLKEKHQSDWIIQESVSFARDDRMFDERVNVPILF